MEAFDFTPAVDADREAGIVRRNEGIVVWMAGEAKARHGGRLPEGSDEEDLLQEGRIALLNAARTYDGARGTKFSTYAVNLVRNAMTDLYERGRSLCESRMEEAGMKRLSRDDGSVGEAALSGSGTDVNHEDHIGDQAVHEVTLEKMCNRFNGLPLRQRKILARRYGLKTGKEQSFAETAAYFHLTERSVRRTEKDALRALRNAMNDGNII